MIKVRRANMSDIKEIMELFYDTVHNINIKDYSKEQVNAWAPKNFEVAKFQKFVKENIFFVAEHKGRIVGFGDLDKDGYLNCLYTHKDFQNRGAGSKIVNIIEEKAKKLGFTEIITEASITAKSFFQRKGFKCLKKQNKEHNGVSFINYKMKKQL
ncbi:GNAT family N-acetyltransferase [Thermohalobacter berrensis]|uniref:GNAT family N-acetyltransferase n=1 Tax=Thermohalobacter berrensis TaxID=99594 RepID=A0A419SZ19_9FIRM|nr:GNAT family N-acetyltransferase [Thermohalobacter berrensis]RKD30513.1 GNAT family N-acetyltransferase [Thermohalobacter berrensis]